MSCENTREQLESFALGILYEMEHHEVEAHLQSCDSCRSRLASLRQATRMLKDAFDEEPPEWLSQKTLAILRNKSKRTLFPWIGWGVPALAGVAVVVLILFIQPGIIQKSNAPSDAVLLSRAVEAPVSQKQKAGTASPSPIPAAANRLFPGASVDISDELTVNLKNPVYDRSIYDNLGVKKEVARLLL